MFLKLPDIGWRWGKRIDEKKAYWREHGKKRQLTPSQAVFRAFEDIADTLYAEHPDKERMQSTWVELAQAQYYAASTADWDGPWIPPEQRLAERWQLTTPPTAQSGKLTNRTRIGGPKKSSRIASTEARLTPDGATYWRAT